MACYALWFDKCTKYFHEAYESSSKALHRQVCCFYFDDILVYSRGEEEHTKHLHQVLSIVAREKLYGNSEKCHFFSSQVIFLGYVVSAQGIHVNDSKIKAIYEWPIPSSI